MTARITPGLTDLSRIERAELDPVVGRAPTRSQGFLLPAAGYLLLAVGTVLLIASRPASDRLADLQVYRGAVQAVHAGDGLYGFHAANGDPFTYPPFAALVLTPLTWIPGPVAATAWTVATLIALVAIGYVFAARGTSTGAGPFAPGRHRMAWVFACVLLASAPAQSNMRFGQVSVFIVLLTLIDVAGLLPGRWAGVGVGVAAAVKLTPLLFVAHFLVTARPRQARRAVVTFAACAGLGWLVLPDDSRTFWSSALFRTDRIGDLADPGNQSLHGIALRTGMPASWQTGAWLISALVVCAVALRHAHLLHRRGDAVSAGVVTGCATVAASPLSWTHHQFWPVLAVLVLVTSRRRTRAMAGWLLLAVMTLGMGTLVDASLPSALAFIAVNVRGLVTTAVCILGARHLSRGHDDVRAAHEARSSRLLRSGGLRAHSRRQWSVVQRPSRPGCVDRGGRTPRRGGLDHVAK